MHSLFSTWTKLSKHAGAMLMAPSMLAIAVIAFSFFSWNRQTVEEVPLLDLAMEIRVDLEHANLLLFQIDKGLKDLHTVQRDQEELETAHDRVIEFVDGYFASMLKLKSNVSSLQKGTTTMGSVTLSNVEVEQISDEELISSIELLATMVEHLDSHLQPELAGDGYQSFSYSMVDGELFAEAMRSAAVCDERVHALLQERLVVQHRLFLLLLIAFTLLAGYLFFKWRKLNRDQENCLADIYLTSQASEQSSEPLLILSAEGVIEYANPAYVEQSGFDSSDVVGKHLSEIAAEASSGWVDDVIKSIADNNPWQGEVETMNRQGEAYGSLIMASPLLDRTLSPAFFMLRQRL
ncbi:PAS domain S-box protein [Mariprofundus sp. NF]|uniref:PAS domain S-box protein n=1 Tax=Mariprofundus sp. NF TaxID=2608716 RepID=UPI0015A4B487|nr:PAS domain S-box protein [Mariprofundus sp. NF]NWF38751.1 PAS domain S-box protein [Mariprofundus sp. NF]